MWVTLLLPVGIPQKTITFLFLASTFSCFLIFFLSLRNSEVLGRCFLMIFQKTRYLKLARKGFQVANVK